MNVVILSKQPEGWQGFKAALESEGASVHFESNKEAYFSLLKTQDRALHPEWVIFDELEDLAEVRKTLIELMMINAVIHTSVCTNIDPEEFHEVTEGLGVLGAISVEKNAQEAQHLLAELKLL